MSGDAHSVVGAAASPGEGRLAAAESSAEERVDPSVVEVAEQPVTPAVKEGGTAEKPVTLPHFIPFSVESTPGVKKVGGRHSY